MFICTLLGLLVETFPDIPFKLGRIKLEMSNVIKLGYLVSKTRQKGVKFDVTLHYTKLICEFSNSNLMRVVSNSFKMETYSHLRVHLKAIILFNVIHSQCP